MSVWMCRAGKFGEREDFALDHGRAVIGWEEMSDFSDVDSRDDLLLMLQQVHQEAKLKTLENWRNQLWAFIKSMKVGDLVVLPQKLRPAIAIGRVVGEYEFHPESIVKHSRKVEWLQREVPRVQFAKDLLYSLGASQTVCKIARNHAEERIGKFLKGATPSVSEVDSAQQIPGSSVIELVDGMEGSVDVDVQEYADDKLRSFIKEHFSGHDLARLVEGILAAKGYKTLNSEPGRDGGVDILAGRGELGFEHPKICVQVKSQDVPLDVGVLRELQATVTNFGAEFGLLIGWGGFNRGLLAESKRLFFKIRLWDSSDLLSNLFEVYPHLSPELQSTLPLKQIWTLVETGG